MSEMEKGQNEPLVSVIIPVYNAALYLQECLDSIYNQTLKDIEIICIDDDSTDNSMGILKRNAQLDSRVKIIHQHKADAGTARNNGLQIARGKYLAFLDADDLFSPDMLEHAYNHAERTHAQVVAFRTSRFYEKSKKIDKCPWTIKRDLIPDKEVFAADEIQDNFFMALLGYTWDKLFLKSFIADEGIKFQEQPVFNDSYFTYTALLVADGISILDEYLIYQRKREAKNSITDRRSLYFDCGYALLIALRDFMQRRGLAERFARDFNNYAVHLLSLDLQSKHNTDNYPAMLDFVSEKTSNDFDFFKFDDDYFYDINEYRQFSQRIHNYQNHTDKEITLVYATDLGYFRYVVTSIESAIQSKEFYSTYKFVVLVQQREYSEEERILSDIVGQNERCSLEYIEVGDVFDDVDLHIEHITTPTFFRLLLPNLLTDCDKCIYIDGDTIVCEDLNELYRTNLTYSYIAGVRAFVYYQTKNEHSQRLGISSDSFEYVNAGVLVMNLALMRQDNCVEQFMGLVSQSFESQDQDIINLVSQGKITILPWKFNVMTKYRKWAADDFSGLASADEIYYGRRHPVIIHYADKVKPWNAIRSSYSDKWWKTALSGMSWKLFQDDKADMLVASLRAANKKSDNEARRARRYQREIDNIHKSISYKVGRFITYIPRKIRSCLRK